MYTRDRTNNDEQKTPMPLGSRPISVGDTHRLQSSLFHWIGLRVDLQEHPIFNGKNNCFRLIFSLENQNKANTSLHPIDFQRKWTMVVSLSHILRVETTIPMTCFFPAENWIESQTKWSFYRRRMVDSWEILGEKCMIGQL